MKIKDDQRNSWWNHIPESAKIVKIDKFTIVFVGFYCVEMIFCFSSLSLVSSTHECLQHSLARTDINESDQTVLHLGLSSYTARLIFILRRVMAKGNSKKRKRDTSESSRVSGSASANSDSTGSSVSSKKRGTSTRRSPRGGVLHFG